MRHDSREGEVIGKRAHQLWKYCSGLSAAVSMVVFGFSVAGWFWHSWGESEHQKDIDRIDDDKEWELAEKMAGHANADAYVVSLRDVMDEADEDSNMFVDPSKVGKKH